MKFTGGVAVIVVPSFLLGLAAYLLYEIYSNVLVSALWE